MHGLLGYLGVSTCRVLHGLVQGRQSQLSVGVEGRPGFQCDHFCGVSTVPPCNTHCTMGVRAAYTPHSQKSADNFLVDPHSRAFNQPCIVWCYSTFLLNKTRVQVDPCSSNPALLGVNCTQTEADFNVLF